MSTFISRWFSTRVEDIFAAIYGGILTAALVFAVFKPNMSDAAFSAQATTWIHRLAIPIGVLAAVGFLFVTRWVARRMWAGRLLAPDPESVKIKYHYKTDQGVYWPIRVDVTPHWSAAAYWHQRSTQYEREQERAALIAAGLRVF